MLPCQGWHRIRHGTSHTSRSPARRVTPRAMSVVRPGQLRSLADTARGPDAHVRTDCAGLDGELQAAARPLQARDHRLDSSTPGSLLLGGEADVVPTPGRYPAEDGESRTFAPARLRTPAAESGPADSQCIRGASADCQQDDPGDARQENSTHTASVAILGPRSCYAVHGKPAKDIGPA